MSIEQAINNLADAINNLAKAKETTVTPLPLMDLETIKKTIAQDPDPTPAPEPVEEAEAAAPVEDEQKLFTPPAEKKEPEPEPEPKPTPAKRKSKGPSIDDVHASLKRYFDSRGEAETLRFLQKFGYQKLSQIPKVKYSEFIDAINEELG